MIGKQFFLDIVIVLSIPVLAMGGYMLWFRDPSGPLLSVDSRIMNAQQNAPGAATKEALLTLNTISLNDSLFKDPAFLSLTTYTVEIPTSELSREYPFTPTQEISEMLRRAKVTSSKNSIQPTKAESISVKLDMLKSSVTK